MDTNEGQSTLASDLQKYHSENPDELCKKFHWRI